MCQSEGGGGEAMPFDRRRWSDLEVEFEGGVIAQAPDAEVVQVRVI